MAKILVAEDDKFLANAYRVKLTKSGYEVHIAGDGQEATEELSSFTPDLVILDLIMPVKDGFAVLTEMKQSDKWKHIPVLVASNLGQKEDVEKAKGLGADDFVVKSDLSMETLVGKVAALLKK